MNFPRVHKLGSVPLLLLYPSGLQSLSGPSFHHEQYPTPYPFLYIHTIHEVSKRKRKKKIKYGSSNVVIHLWQEINASNCLEIFLVHVQRHRIDLCLRNSLNCHMSKMGIVQPRFFFQDLTHKKAQCSIINFSLCLPRKANEYNISYICFLLMSSNVKLVAYLPISSQISMLATPALWKQDH